MKKLLCIVLTCTIFYCGCAGRTANPVSMVLPEDKTLTCKGIEQQMDFCGEEMDKLKPQTNKFGTNTLWFVAGVILLVPFFFMDFKDAEKVEYDAYGRRLSYLKTMYSDKNCAVDGGNYGNKNNQ